VSRIVFAPSRDLVASSDSWQGRNSAVLAAWAAEEGRTSTPPKPAIARTKRLTGFQIVATGSYAPENRITNDDLRAIHGFAPEWILQRTGIRERRHTPTGMATSDLCREACLRCLRSAGVSKEDVEFLIVATHTPDLSIPGTACLVQEQLGLFCGAFDVQAACSGFMYALAIGAQFVRTGNASCCLVVGADVPSRIVNPEDQNTYPLFGDGAGAVLLAPGSQEQGFLAYELGTDGSGSQLLGRPLGGSHTPLTTEMLQNRQHYVQMNGRAVFRWAIETVCRSLEELFHTTGLTAADISLFVPHQANQRITATIGERLGLPAERVYSNIERYGNTMAGSIPLALDEAIAEGRIHRGDRVLLSGFGAGLSWGSAILQW
jgi:3-oxoacyl-[acyl-carrier-protein] synthase-3